MNPLDFVPDPEGLDGLEHGELLPMICAGDRPSKVFMFSTPRSYDSHIYERFNMHSEEKKKKIEACSALAKKFGNEAIDRVITVAGLSDLPMVSTPRTRYEEAVRKSSGEVNHNFTRKDLARNFAESTMRSAYALKDKIESENKDTVISIEEILNTKEFLMECATAFGNALGRKGIYREYCVPTRIVKTRKLIKMARPMFSTVYGIQQTAFYEGYNQMLSQLKNYEWTFYYE